MADIPQMRVPEETLPPLNAKPQMREPALDDVLPGMAKAPARPSEPLNENHLTASEQRKQDLERERLTHTIGGGKVGDGISDGALVVQMFLNKKIAEGTLAGVEPLTLDGNNGNATREAVREFQKQHFLRSRDGYVGQETYAMMVKTGFDLDAALAEKDAYLKTEKSKTLAPTLVEASARQELSYVLGSSSEKAVLPLGRQGFAVAAIQSELHKSDAALAIDGVWKKEDQASLERWQEQAKLDGRYNGTPDGKFGKRSYEAMPKESVDVARFKQELHDKDPELAGKLAGLETLEGARRQHGAGLASASGGHHSLPKLAHNRSQQL